MAFLFNLNKVPHKHFYYYQLIIKLPKNQCNISYPQHAGISQKSLLHLKNGIIHQEKSEVRARGPALPRLITLAKVISSG
jgi:hypothetical protein